MSQPDHDDQISAVRAFNRFYTSKLGVLDQQLLKSPFSLSEARVLYELATCESPSAKEIGIELGLDPGYLSRIVQKFDEDGLITRKPSARGSAAISARPDREGPSGVRETRSQLARRCRRHARHAVRRRPQAPDRGDGRNRAAARSVRRRRRPRPYANHARATWDGWCRAMARSMPANTALTPRSRPWSRRSPQNSWARSMPRGNAAGSPNSMAPRSVRFFSSGTATTSPNCDCCWSIPPDADRDWDGGSSRECIAFARACGYRKITLWTQSILVAARKIYQDAGFVLVASEPHRSFGQSLIGETWEMKL